MTRQLAIECPPGQAQPGDSDEPDPASPEPGWTGAHWLGHLGARLGLGSGGSLRGALERALAGQSASASEFTTREREMLLRILRFGALRVEDAMVPRADIVAVDEQTPIADLLKIFEEAGHSRIPVYRKTLDDLLGMIHIKDLVTWIAETARQQARVRGRGPQTVKCEGDRPGGSEAGRGGLNGAGGTGAPNGGEGPLDLDGIDLAKPISSAGLRRDVLFVPPSMPAVNLLLRMQSTRVHLAMVVDEYGGTDGLISIEDLVEEIVGEIEDEHDENGGELITKDPKLGLVAAARTPIDELEAYLSLPPLDEEGQEDIDTLGGLVFSLAGHVPVCGELVRHPAGIEFEILDADPRRIKKLRIHVGKRPVERGSDSQGR